MMRKQDKRKGQEDALFKKLCQLDPVKNQLYQTEIGVAQIFSELFCDRLRFNATVKRWFFYDGVRWCQDVGGAYSAEQAKTLYRLMIQFGAKIASDAIREKYGHNAKELSENEWIKRKEVEAGEEKRKNPTINNYYELWADARINEVKEATIRTQRKIFDILSKIYIPTASKQFGQMRMRDVTIQDLRYMQNELLKTRKAASVNDYMAHLKHVFKDAANERILEYNPCVLLKNLKCTEEEKARDTNHRALTIEETKAFFDCERTKRSVYYNVFRFAILTGMRVGEIGALKNTDIHGGFIHVSRTITRTEAGTYIIGKTAKTKAGRREIPLTKAMNEVLASQRELNRLLDGNNIMVIDDTIFKAAERGLLVATPIDREIKKIHRRIIDQNVDFAEFFDNR